MNILAKSEPVKPQNLPVKPQPLPIQQNKQQPEQIIASSPAPFALPNKSALVSEDQSKTKQELRDYLPPYNNEYLPPIEEESNRTYMDWNSWKVKHKKI